MKKIKILIICIILIIVILVILLSLNIKNKEKAMPDFDTQVNGGDQIIISDEFHKVDNATMYYTVVNCLDIFLKNSDVQESKYYMLSKETIKNNNINLKNITEKINFLDNETEIKIKQMQILDRGDIHYYKVDYCIDENDINQIFVILDNSQMTFAIEFYNKDWTMENLQTEIKRNDYNVYTYVRVNEEQMARKYILDFIDKSSHNPEEAYAILDEEFRNERFKNQETFKKYVKNNMKVLNRMVLYQYQVIYGDDYNSYICMNQYGEYWIFKETAVMQYKVILDTYTLDLPEFLEKYNSTNNQGKVALNIQKFMQSIDAKDYSYAYSKLADSFKNNYFKTEEQFKNYIKEHTFEMNNVEYKTYSLQGQNHIYELILTDKSGNSTVRKNLNIVMQLKEGTDFVMSFEVEE